MTDLDAPQTLIRQVIEDVNEAGPLLYALCGLADEQGTTLTFKRSPRGALVIFSGEPERFIASDDDETEALRKAERIMRESSPDWQPLPPPPADRSPRGETERSNSNDS